MENKNSKYFKYAIGEIVLVVIGILIALQINTWNQHRVDKKKEIILLKQLIDNFKANKRNIDKGLKKYNVYDDYLTSVLRHTGPNVEIPNSEILDSIGSINYITVELVFGSKNNMFSNEQIQLITNNELRSALFTFPNYFDDYRDSENLIKELTITQRKIHQKHMSLLAHESRFEKNAFKSDTLGWLRDRDFQNVTVDKYWVSKQAVYNLEILADQNLRIFNLLTTLVKD